MIHIKIQQKNSSLLEKNRLLHNAENRGNPPEAHCLLLKHGKLCRFQQSSYAPQRQRLAQ